ncbi:MAG: hypothetical protein ACHBN1_14460 [Heteroscytonema crispum UTEX LB 1556]
MHSRDAGSNTHEVRDANWERVFRTNLDGLSKRSHYVWFIWDYCKALS